MKTKCLQPFGLSAIIVLCLTFHIPANASGTLETTGKIIAVCAPLSAAGLTCLKKDQVALLQFCKAEGITLCVTYGLKYLLKEERPDKSDYHSFPSSHTSTSFCSAEFIRKRYGWKYGLPAYLLAGIAGYSRVEAKRHYIHDVIAGAGIGILSSTLLSSPYQKVSLTLQSNLSQQGLSISYVW